MRFVALPQHTAERLCLSGALSFELMLEATPQAFEAQPQNNQSTVAGKPEAYRTVLRQSRFMK